MSSLSSLSAGAPIEPHLTRVLIVEDESLTARFFEVRLTKLGYVVAGIVDSGPDALEFLEHQEVDLVLLDIMLRGPYDGIELAERMMKQHHLPFIFITSHTDDATFERAKSTSPYGYVIKPVEVQTLRVTIEIALARFASEMSSKLFTQIFEHATLGMLILDAMQPNLRTIYCNGALQELSGYSADEISDATLNLFFGSETDPGAIAEIDRALQDQTTCNLELVIRRKDNTPRWCELALFPVKVRRRSTACFVCFLWDLSEKKRMEQIVMAAQKFELIGTVIGTIAHDINNFLTSLLGFAELAQSEPGNSPAVERCLSEITGLTEKSGQILRQLLTLSTAQPDKKDQIVLSAKILSMEDMLRKTAGPTVNITLDVAHSSQRIDIDQVHIEQLLLNLVVNARDAMPEGGTLMIALERAGASPLKDGGTRSVVLRVSDTGVGIEPNELPMIFEAFYTKKVKEKGTGLGLVSCRRIVELAGGTISVRSQRGEGTCFEIVFPESSSECLAENATDTSLIGGFGELILLVDDDPRILEVSEKMLVREGYRVRVASGVQEAIAMLEQDASSFALIITDYYMPDGGGVRLCDYVRDLRLVVPIMLVTGYVESPIPERTRFTRILLKPYGSAALLQATRDCLSGVAPTVPIIAPSPSPSARRKALVVEDMEGLRLLLVTQLGLLGFDTVDTDCVEEARAVLSGSSFDLIVSDFNLRDGRLTSLLDSVRSEVPDLFSKTLVITGNAREDMIDLMAPYPGTRILQKPFNYAQFSNEVREIFPDIIVNGGPLKSASG